MAQTTIQNVKVLHKRYSASEWLSGKTNNNNPLYLANGELGFDTTNGILKIGTLDNSTWEQAREVRKQDIESRYKSGDNYVESAPQSVSKWFISKIEYQKVIINNVDQQCYKLIIYYDDFENSIKYIIDNYVDIPELTLSDDNTQDTADQVAVVKDISKEGYNSLRESKILVPTKDYVDNKFSTSKTVSVEKNPTTTLPDDGSSKIEYVSQLKQSTKDHTVEYEVKELVLPQLDIDDQNIDSGKFISGIKVDPSDDHKILVTKSDLPTLTANSNSSSDSSAKIISGIDVNNYSINSTKKSILGDGNVISISSNDTSITISADTYTKSEIDQLHEIFDNAIDELGKSMEFAGTLASNGTGTLTELPIASDNTIGHVYKVSFADTYNNKQCKVGDMFICDSGKIWRYIPSGDETFTDTWRGIQVNGTSVKDNSIGGGDINFAAGDGATVTHSSGTITVGHADTSTVEDLSPSDRTYVKSLDFDEYGHVVGYSVGTEQDQEIPNQIQNASGGETAANLEFISQATLSKDTSNNIVLTTDTKKVAATDKINVAENGSTITFKHDTIITNTATDTSKNTTITAGSDNKTFTVVDTITSDGYGHITDVKTKTVTVEIPVYEDTDTTYTLPVSANGTTKADITLTGSDDSEDKATIVAGDGLNILVSGDEIILKGKVAADILGMIKAHLVTAGEANAASAILPSIDNSINDRFYQLNVKEDGTAFVQVPWKNTEYTSSNGVQIIDNDIQHSETGDINKVLDMYAFGTDAYGHVTGAVSITTLDGNVD